MKKKIWPVLCCRGGWVLWWWRTRSLSICKFFFSKVKKRRNTYHRLQMFNLKLITQTHVILKDQKPCRVHLIITGMRTSTRVYIC